MYQQIKSFTASNARELTLDVNKWLGTLEPNWYINSKQFLARVTASGKDEHIAYLGFYAVPAKKEE